MPVFERTVNFFAAAGMDGGQALEWNRRMYFVGGFNGTIYNGGTFCSPNGQDVFIANAHNDASSLSGRAFHRMVVHENRLFVTGGFDGTNALNDCWMYDGKWTRIATNIGGARYGHLMWSFDGRLFVSGGTDGSNVLSDVWTSYDGTIWRRLIAANTTLGRFMSAGCVYDKRMYFTGGTNGTAALQDVYSSVNGMDWVRHAAPPDFPACCCHTLTSWNNKMVLITGATGFDQRSVSGVFAPSQLWYSEDGTHWVRGSDDLEFSRANHAAFAYGERQRLIVTCGTDGATRYADIWQTRGEEFLNRAWAW